MIWKSRSRPDSRHIIDGDLWFSEPWTSDDQRRVHVHLSGGGEWGVMAKLVVGGEERMVGLTLALGRWFLHISVREFFTRAFSSRVYAWAKRVEPETKTLTGTWAYQLHWLDSSRETGISAHDGAVWFNLWKGDDWSNRDRSDWPWRTSGWQWVLPWKDLLLGRVTVDDGEVVTEPAEVVIPARVAHGSIVLSAEERYPAEVTHRRRRWGRRWWRGPWVWQSAIDIPGGIPFPGKGENSWDCGMDGLYGMSVPVTPERPTAESVAAQAAASVIETRERRGHPPYRLAE
jgi:hypothetical protein